MGIEEWGRTNSKEKMRVYQREYARKRRAAKRGIIEEVKVYQAGDILTLYEAGRVLGYSPAIVEKWQGSGKLKSLAYSDIMEFKVEWDKAQEGKLKLGIGELNKGREKRIGVNLIRVRGRIMDEALLLERVYGTDLFKKRMAILYNTTEKEVEAILESRAFIKRRVEEDKVFLNTNDEGTVLMMTKQLLLNPNTKDATANKLVETINEIVKQKGTGKKWFHREMGNKGDPNLKTYEIGNE